jgi:hypothetical protein
MAPFRPKKALSRNDQETNSAPPAQAAGTLGHGDIDDHQQIERGQCALNLLRIGRRVGGVAAVDPDGAQPIRMFGKDGGLAGDRHPSSVTLVQSWRTSEPSARSTTTEEALRSPTVAPVQRRTHRLHHIRNLRERLFPYRKSKCSYRACDAAELDPSGFQVSRIEFEVVTIATVSELK